MNIRIKGGKIILSQAPANDVPGAFLIVSPKVKDKEFILDAVKGQKEYKLPEKITRKDIEAVYLRVI